MKIEIWFDFICPFCYLGERKLEMALADFRHRAETELIFKSFQLNMQAGSVMGKDINQVIADKYHISYAQAKASNDNIIEAAREVGLNYRFDILKMNSTALAHEITHYAGRYGKSHDLIRRYFKGYFEEGLDIGDEESLVKLAEETGIDMAEFKNLQSTGSLKSEIRSDEEAAGKAGINSIPHFIINGKYTVSGAQSPEYFLKVLNTAYEDMSR
ncbi:DsbA family oxidoreductase [Lachnospiraceae bacterium 54-53]